MQKMGLLRNVLKSGNLIRVGHQNPRISSFLRDSPRAFSTAGGTTTQDSPPILDPFLHNPNTGLIGALTGITGYTTKNDILNLLEDCNLKPEDLKFEYAPDFTPYRMLIQFPSSNAGNTALKTLARKSRAYRLVWISADNWEKSKTRPYYDGKALLLQGLPQNAVANDIERLLSGCHHMDIRFFNRDAVKMATVHFPSAILARLAFLTTVREFCLNNQVLARVLF